MASRLMSSSWASSTVLRFSDRRGDGDRRRLCGRKRERIFEELRRLRANFSDAADAGTSNLDSQLLHDDVTWVFAGTSASCKRDKERCKHDPDANARKTDRGTPQTFWRLGRIGALYFQAIWVSSLGLLRQLETIAEFFTGAPPRCISRHHHNSARVARCMLLADKHVFPSTSDASCDFFFREAGGPRIALALLGFPFLVRDAEEEGHKSERWKSIHSTASQTSAREGRGKKSDHFRWD